MLRLTAVARGATYTAIMILCTKCIVVDVLHRISPSINFTINNHFTGFSAITSLLGCQCLGLSCSHQVRVVHGISPYHTSAILGVRAQYLCPPSTTGHQQSLVHRRFVAPQGQIQPSGATNYLLCFALRPDPNARIQRLSHDFLSLLRSKPVEQYGSSPAEPISSQICAVVMVPVHSPPVLQTFPKAIESSLKSSKFKVQRTWCLERVRTHLYYPLDALIKPLSKPVEVRQNLLTVGRVTV